MVVRRRNISLNLELVEITRGVLRKKVISEEQARLSAQSNVILKALGITPDIEVEIEERPYLKGDRFILCTDGFWEYVCEEEMETTLSNAENPQKWLSSMEQLLRTRIPEDTDNYTAAAVFC